MIHVSVLLAAALALPGASPKKRPHPSFATSEAAVAFVAEQVRHDHFDSLYLACTAPDDRETVVFVARRLKALDRKTPLPKLYQGRPFPASGTTFELGGHGDPWEHIHIGFTRADGSWKIENLWMCR